MDAIGGINNEYIEKFAYIKPAKMIVMVKRILPFAACFVLCCVFAVLVINKPNLLFPPINSDSPSQNATTSDQNHLDNSSLEYDSTYINVSEQTSLLRVESISFYDNCYALVSRDEKLQSQEIAIIQATVTEDYYNHLAHGEKIYIAFPLEISWGGQYKIKSAQLIDSLLKCDSLIFYSDSIDDRHFIYHDEQCSPEEKLNLERICFCYYYSEGIIPITNAHVNYSIINNVLESCGINCNFQKEFYENIKQSGISILQGDSIDKVSVTIQELIKNKIYGGDFQ